MEEDIVDEPYNNDNFYALNDEQKIQFQFMNTHPTQYGKSSKRPQSANIRITKDKGTKNKNLKRNQAHQEYRYSAEGGITASSAPDMKERLATTGQFHENGLTNASQFQKSPSKFQK